MAYNECKKLGYSFLTTMTLMNLGQSLNAMGSRMEAAGLFKEYIDGMTREYGKPLPYIGIIYVGMSGLCYENNELDKAKLYMDEGSKLCQSIFYNWIENKGILESRLLFALGEKEIAIDTIKKSINAMLDAHISEMLVLNTATLVELLLKINRFDEAMQYGEKLKRYMSYRDIPASREAILPCARLLIYQEHNEEALALLDSIEPQIEKILKGKDIITFYILYSKTLYAAKDYQKAEYYLDRAVNQAEPQGYCRLFLDEAPVITDFLSGKIAKGNFIIKIAELIKAQQEAVPPDSMTEKAIDPRQSGLAGQECIERLSNREIEILVLLTKGMTNQEIANTLYISVNTAQWHISQIYSKLGVHNRMQAVHKAQELQIL